ncbi:MAG: class IV adenylate cyclase [Candidatus Alkanophagales archaeon]
MFEVEVKARVGEETKRLVRARCRFLRAERHVDIYFDAPHRRLAESGEVLRLRQIDGRAVLTYKRGRADGGVRVREEIEVRVGDGDAAAEILKRLGFRVLAEIRKRREVFELGGCQISLDDVEGLGEFLEVELKSGDVPNARSRILGLLRELGVGDDAVEKRPYLQLYLEKFRARS